MTTSFKIGKVYINTATDINKTHYANTVVKVLRNQNSSEGDRPFIVDEKNQGVTVKVLVGNSRHKEGEETYGCLYLPWWEEYSCTCPNCGAEEFPDLLGLCPNCAWILRGGS